MHVCESHVFPEKTRLKAVSARKKRNGIGPDPISRMLPFLGWLLCSPRTARPKGRRYTDNRPLPTAYCPLPTALCLLPSAYCLLRWRQFHGQSECLRLSGKVTFLGGSEYRCLFSVVPIGVGGVTSGEPRGLHGPRRGIDPRRLRTRTDAGPPPRVPVGCRDCGTCGSSIVRWSG